MESRLPTKTLEAVGDDVGQSVHLIEDRLGAPDRRPWRIGHWHSRAWRESCQNFEVLLTIVAALPMYMCANGFQILVQPAPRDVGARIPKALIVAAVGLVVGLSVVHFLYPDGWIGIGSYLTVTIGASAMAWVSVHLWGGATRFWLAVGISASAVGDATFQYYVLIRHVVPDVSFADIPWIASYVGVSLGLLHLLRRGGRDARTDVDGLIDMVVVALVAMLVLWQFWLHSTFLDASVPVSVRLVWAAYPILDSVMLALVVRTVIERRTHTITGLLLTGGVVLWLVSDFLFMILVPGGTVGVLLDVGWMVGAVLLAAGCSYDMEHKGSASEGATQRHVVGKARLSLAIAPLLVPATIECIAFLDGYDANPVPLVIATAAFAGLIALRALRLLRLRDQAQSDLELSERLFRALVANSSDAVLLLDANGVVTNEAPNLATLLGHKGVSTVGHRALDFVSDRDSESLKLFDEAVLSPGVMLSGEARSGRPDGSEIWLSIRAVNMLDDDAVRAIVVTVHDITDRKLAEEELIHQAFHDSLTGLANRALFRDRVEHALSRRSRSGMDPAVIYFDLDSFKNVNDGLGHEAGDALLREVAARLLGVVRSGDTVARLGGDEFAVLVEESQHVQIEAEAIAERALQSLAAPLSVGGQEVTITASLGIAHADDESTAVSLLRDADVAMYQAKTSGKACWTVYEPTMRASAVERLQLENDLNHVVDKDQLRLVYQPVVELETNRIVGFEALVRWEHPSLGTVMPDKFIPIAEENGTIIAIGQWVLQTACLTAAGWGRRYPAKLSMAVNLSARQLAAPEVLDHVRTALRDAELDASTLVLEMTETALVQDPVQAAARLHQLRALGVRLAIDDFGTGYSSLSYLRQFPVDILKIDRTFINTITDGEKVPAIVRGLLDLGRTLQLETVAEGIESDAQLDQLRDEQCELGQGFLFARPLLREDAELLLDSVAFDSVAHST
jgi:diguanylate cyclase (GGDEF)-like protein/PAS domain S-box-containing protein